MVAVITGDIIHSRKVSADLWLPKLKAYFAATLADDHKWEIYRGDSFQIEVELERALEVALCIKALIKSIHHIDVRMALGIGTTDRNGHKVTESYGSAHIYSGERFEKIKNDTLVLQSPFQTFDDYFNPILKLLSFISSHWKPITAETIFFCLTHRYLLQKEVAEQLSKDKTTVNKALKRGGYAEVIEIIDLYHNKIQQCLN